MAGDGLRPAKPGKSRDKLSCLEEAQTHSATWVGPSACWLRNRCRAFQAPLLSVLLKLEFHHQNHTHLAFLLGWRHCEPGSPDAKDTVELGTEASWLWTVSPLQSHPKATRTPSCPRGSLESTHEYSCCFPLHRNAGNTIAAILLHGEVPTSA